MVYAVSIVASHFPRFLLTLSYAMSCHMASFREVSWTKTWRDFITSCVLPDQIIVYFTLSNVYIWRWSVSFTWAWNFFSNPQAITRMKVVSLKLFTLVFWLVAVTARHNRGLHGPGSIYKPGPVSGLFQMIAVNVYRTFRAFSVHSFFSNKKSFVVSVILCVGLSGSENKSHRLDFIRNFRSCPFLGIGRDNALHISHLMSFYR
jgi:hypothetical protein